MVTHRRLTLALVLWCLLLYFCGLPSASGSAQGEGESMELVFAGGRHLLQDTAQCPHQWGGDNFTVLEENCPYVVNITLDYDKKRCCTYGLGGMLCPYLALVDDTSTNCANSFWTILPLAAPNYTNDWFSLICTDPNSPQGIECPPNSTGNSSDPGSGSAPSSHSFWFSLLIAIAIFEILVLLF
ncbi:unnamed protein product [Calypogeia fissa]